MLCRQWRSPHGPAARPAGPAGEGGRRRHRQLPFKSHRRRRLDGNWMGLGSPIERRFGWALDGVLDGELPGKTGWGFPSSKTQLQYREPTASLATTPQSHESGAASNALLSMPGRTCFCFFFYPLPPSYVHRRTSTIKDTTPILQQRPRRSCPASCLRHTHKQTYSAHKRKIKHPSPAPTRSPCTAPGRPPTAPQLAPRTWP